MSGQPAQPEFSRMIDADDVPAEGLSRVLTPDADERAAIAARLGLISLDAFTADIEVMPWHGGGAVLTGRIEADVVQRCVVTLDPVPDHIAEDFEAHYLPPDRITPPDPDEEVEIGPDSEDAPEPLGGPTGTQLDAGEAAVQFLSLALDPYPRKPDAELPDAARGEPEPSPFAVLAALKSDKDKDEKG